MKIGKLKLLILFTLLVALMVTLTGCGGAEKKEEPPKQSEQKQEEPKPQVKARKLNYGITLVMDNHYGLLGLKWNELIKQKTNGELELAMFPSSQLGGEVQMIQAARAGTQDTLVTAQAVLENTIPEWSLFDVPYLFDSVEQANKVLSKGKVPEEFLKMLEPHGLIGFGFLSVMERNVFSNNPIETVDDMKGMKVRVMQSPGYVGAYNALGASPTPMAYNEVYVALQQKVVDGADTSPDQFMQDKFVEVAKYYNITKVHYLPAVLLMGQPTWKSLTQEQQKAVTEAADEALEYARGIYMDHYNKAIKDMQDRGVTVVKPDLTEFKKKAQPAVEQLVKDIPRGQELFDMIQEAKK